MLVRFRRKTHRLASFRTYEKAIFQQTAKKKDLSIKTQTRREDPIGSMYVYGSLSLEL